MKLTYAVSEQEYQRGLALFFKDQKRPPVGTLITTALIYTFAGLVACFIRDSVSFRLLTAIIFGGMLVVTAVRTLTPNGRAKALIRYQRKHGMLGEGAFGPHGLEAREAQLVVTYGGREVALAWQSLFAVKEAEGYVLLLRDGGELFTAIPPSAFLEPQWRATLVEELRRRMCAPSPVEATPVAEDAERVVAFPPWTEEELVEDLVAADWMTLRPVLILVPLLLVGGLLAAPALTHAGIAMLESGNTAGLLLTPVISLLGLAAAIAAFTGFVMIVFLAVALLPWIRGKRRKLVAGGSLRAWLGGAQRMVFTGFGMQVDRSGSAETIPWTALRWARPMKKGGILVLCRGFRIVPIPASAFSCEAERAELLIYLAAKRVKGRRQGG